MFVLRYAIAKEELPQLAAFRQVAQIAIVEKFNAHQPVAPGLARTADVAHRQRSRTLTDAHKIRTVGRAGHLITALHQWRLQQIAQVRSDAQIRHRLAVAPHGGRLIGAVKQHNQLMIKHIVQPATDVLI